MRFCLLCFIKLYLKSNRSPLPGLYLCIFCSSLLPEISFNWKITALQSCVGFCCSTWISYRHTYIPSLFSLLPTPPPPYPSRSTTLYVDHMLKYNPTFSPSLSTWAKCITFLLSCLFSAKSYVQFSTIEFCLGWVFILIFIEFNATTMSSIFLYVLPFSFHYNAVAIFFSGYLSRNAKTTYV